MKRKWLFLILGAAVVLPVACFFYVTHEKTPKVFKTCQIETGLSWFDNPDVELNPQSMKKLNREVVEQIQLYAPGAKYGYPVVSLGKGRLEVMYSGEPPGAPEAIQIKLNSFIKKRASELAGQQPLPQSSIHSFNSGAMMWTDGPDVKLSSTNTAKINQEIATLLEKEYPAKHYQFTVTSTGQKFVSYHESRINLPDSVWKEMSAYAGKRVMELAYEQAAEERAQTTK